MKYSINGTGNIVAERDIYSLGGFIPKGTVGGKIASEEQLSQDGECWLAAGDISGRPDIVIKDNAYIGTFTPGASPVHTDGITEFSGNTLIPGNISVRALQTYAKCNFYVKDSFIGVTMDVLCGPATTTTAFPFEQGWYNQTVSKGTLFSAMKASSDNFVRSTATIRLGKDTYLYTPAGYNARILWAYYDTSNQLAYAGESEVVSTGLHKLSHPIYKVCMVNIARGIALTPEQLGNSGAKILRHVSGSVQSYLNAASASGNYVMDNCRFAWVVTDFSYSSNGQGIFSGSMHNCNVRGFSPYDLDVCGKFSNIEQLELYRTMQTPDYADPNRDTFITASDCPLLRVTTDFQEASLKAMGDLVLRRCIVPKAEFQNDVINGNTYEDIDFSYANEDLGFTMTGYTRFISSHKQGIYRMSGGPSSTGFVSHKGNLSDTARLYQAEVYLPLDGALVEQGTYEAGGIGHYYYESAKTNSANRVRTGKPIATFGLVFPSLPTGYSVTSLYYLDEKFIIRARVSSPTGLVTTYPYVVMVFRKDDDSAINVTDFIALNRTLRIIDHTKVPEITGSAYVGAGCTVRGDVQLHGDPYVNRVLDVNVWERKALSGNFSNGWEGAKIERQEGDRMLTADLQYIGENGCTVSCATGYWIIPYRFTKDGLYLDNPGWVRSHTFGAFEGYVGILIKKAANASDAGGLIEDSDIPLANVKYVRAFEKRRYITNELDRTSPKDILIGPDYWEQGTTAGGTADAGKTYEALKATSGTTVRIKRPINVSPSTSISTASGFTRGHRVLDAVTKFIAGELITSVKTALLGIVIQKDPSAAITPSEVGDSRIVLEFVPQPRIIVPYGFATLTVNGMRIRMYDNAVLSRNLNQQGEIVLQGDAVMGYDFNSGSCMCSNGHSDAIIKLP